jgi:hypothetical protein
MSHMYLVLIFLVATLTILLPTIIPRLAKKYGFVLHKAPTWLPFLAATLYLASAFLPDIHISPETHTFQEHFVGGGVYTTILYIYFTKLLGLRPRWLIALLGLFAWTSALGTANELLEFSLVKLNVTDINISDTSWDLVANSTGMLSAFVIWRLVKLFNRRSAN